MAITVEYKNFRTNRLEDTSGDTRLDFSIADSVINAPSGGNVLIQVQGNTKLGTNNGSNSIEKYDNASEDRRIAIVSASNSVPTTGGGGTVTASSIRPAGAFILGISWDVVTTIAGAGLTTYDIGDGTVADRYGAAIATASGTLGDMDDATADPFEFLIAAGDIVLTANAGQFDSGNIVIVVYYINLTQL